MHTRQSFESNFVRVFNALNKTILILLKNISCINYVYFIYVISIRIHTYRFQLLEYTFDHFWC